MVTGPLKPYLPLWGFLFLVHENNLAGPSIPSRGFPTGVSELYREDKRS